MKRPREQRRLTITWNETILTNTYTCLLPSEAHPEVAQVTNVFCYVSVAFPPKDGCEPLLPAGRVASSSGRIPGGSRWWRTTPRGWASHSFYKHPWSERGLHPGPLPCCPPCSLEKNQHPMGREFTRSSCSGARIWLWVDQIKALPVLLSWPARSPLCQ